MIRRVRLLLILIAVFMLISPFQLIAQDEIGDNAEILWDVWGVPHIYAPDNESLFYAFGWAYMQAHGDLLLKLFGEARGRAAEYWGEDYLDSDILVHTVDIPGQARASYAAQTDEFRSYLDAFAAGLTAYATANPDLIGDQWEIVLPVTGEDILANGIRSLRYVFLARAGLQVAGLWADPVLIGGSNAWAVGPSRSASGNAMLVINPHQPWFDIGLWFEAHLISPDVNIYGASLMGSPVINVGFNQNLGWAHTVNTHDGWDLYNLTLTEDGTGYLFDGEERTFETSEVTIQVLQADGELEAVPLTVRRSVHGPVVALDDEGTALALRVVGDEAYGAAQQWWDMGRASNLDEFQDVMARLQIPMFTVMYADRAGNIMHLFNEIVPVREEGDWEFWNGVLLTNPDDEYSIIPGDTSRYLWTEFHPYEDLPRVINPDSGWLQNANEPPWTTTFPLAIYYEDYPAYMAPPPFMWPRPQRSARMLYEDDSITFDELLAYKHSTFVELTVQLLDELIAAAYEFGDELTVRAADILAAWDRQTNADSVGAALFTLWFVNYVAPIGVDVFAVQWDIDDPFNTPYGLSDPQGAVEGLTMSARQLELTRPLGGGIDVPYGDAFRLRVGDYDLPANGGFGQIGIFRVLTFTQDSDLRFRPVHGDSFVAVIEFSDPVYAEVLLSYGNATQPGSPHIGDQLTLFAEQELRTAWFTRAEVEANLERIETIIMP